MADANGQSGQLSTSTAAAIIVIAALGVLIALNRLSVSVSI